jgi:hypothetical protein
MKFLFSYPAVRNIVVMFQRTRRVIIVMEKGREQGADSVRTKRGKVSISISDGVQ